MSYLADAVKSDQAIGDDWFCRIVAFLLHQSASVGCHDLFANDRQAVAANPVRLFDFPIVCIAHIASHLLPSQARYFYLVKVRKTAAAAFSLTRRTITTEGELSGEEYGCGTKP
jgi:hypothetical protein